MLFVRPCGTPGCELKDKHAGPCSFEIDLCNVRRASTAPMKFEFPVILDMNDVAPKVIKCSICKLPGHNKRTCPSSLLTPESNALHRDINNFQLAKNAVRECMQYQENVQFSVHTSILKDHWCNDAGLYYDARHTITFVPTDASGNVACGICSQGYAFDFPSPIFLESRTKVCWNKVGDSVRNKWLAELVGEKHVNSIARAYAFIMDEYLILFKPSSEHILMILDGNGENRKGCYDALTDAGIDPENWPCILTFDMNADVVLAGQMLFETKDIIFTGSDPSFKSKSLPGKGVLLEHLIAKRNSLLTEEMKLRVKGVYFDYCGGPPENQNPKLCRENFKDNVFPHLPNIKFYGVTMSYRKHPTLKTKGITDFVPCPDGFRPAKSFHDNRMVFCQFFTTRIHAEKSFAGINEHSLPRVAHKAVTEPVPKRLYLCGICKQPKKGHVCIYSKTTL